MPLAALNPAGGIRHHLNAWRFRDTLWQPYRPEVARVLNDWSPRERKLVVVGPSAGWLLPADFLHRFEVVVAVEPDPVARWLLRRRFPQVNWQMTTEDYFTPTGALPWRDNTARLFDDFDGHALLFTHFLGQLIGLYPDAVAVERDGQLAAAASFVRWKQALRTHLATRTWASLHDRVSSAWPVVGAKPGWHLDLPDELSSAALRQRLWADDAEVWDHLTGELDSGPRRLLFWQRRPDMGHVIEAIWRRR